MAGHHIALLRIICLKDSLQATVASSELKELKMFDHIAHALLQECFCNFFYNLPRIVRAHAFSLSLSPEEKFNV